MIPTYSGATGNGNIPASGEELNSFETQHTDQIHDIQADYFGKRIATCSSDGTVRIFNLENEGPRLVQVLKGHESPVWQVSWSHPKYESIIASCSYDGTVLLWKEVNGVWNKFKEHREHSSSVNSVAWAPASLGLCLACGSSDGKVSILTYNEASSTWDVESFAGHIAGVNAVCWATTSADASAPLKKRLLTAGSDNVIRIWSHSSAGWLEECESLEGHSDWVRDVAWCPNEMLPYLAFASCSQDKTVLLWQSKDDGKTWTPHSIYPSFGEAVWKVSWSVAGNLLAVSYGEGKTCVLRQNLDDEFKWEKIQQVEDGKEVAF
jgi:protein transport protein SEC13